MDDADETSIPGHHVNELAGFFAAHDRWLFGHACVRTQGDRDLAADLVQDTFEAAAIAWSVLRGHPSSRQRAWLLGTLAHKDISDLRRKAAFRRREPEIHARYQGVPADTEAQALNAIALARAREIIDGMPPRQTEIALMRWRDHMRAAEIAAVLGSRREPCTPSCMARGASWSRDWNGITRSARTAGKGPCHDHRFERG